MAKETGKFENNCKVGLWKKWFINDKIQDSGMYCANLNYLTTDWKNGEYILLNKNKEEIKRYNMRNFKIDSFLAIKEIERDKYSIQFPITIYFKEGLWKYYSEDGTLKEEKYFKNGVVIKNTNYPPK